MKLRLTKHVVEQFRNRVDVEATKADVLAAVKFGCPGVNFVRKGGLVVTVLYNKGTKAASESYKNWKNGCDHTPKAYKRERKAWTSEFGAEYFG